MCNSQATAIACSHHSKNPGYTLEQIKDSRQPRFAKRVGTIVLACGKGPILKSNPKIWRKWMMA